MERPAYTFRRGISIAWMSGTVDETSPEDSMTHNHIHIDPALPLVRQADKGHNRWHPDIAPAVRIASGSSVEMETLDGLDGQIKSRTTATDLAGIEMGLKLFVGVRGLGRDVEAVGEEVA